MSKIALKPNDSGTGTFTLEAPNSNTNRTLTLPDSSGTVATEENLPGGYTDSDALDLFNATGSAPVYACRAWVNFDGTGTVSIRASGNVSSITDNGAGDYTVNFATAIPDANYSVTTGINQASSGSNRGHLFGPQLTGAYSTSSVRVVSKLSAGSTGFFDYEFLNVAIFR